MGREIGLGMEVGFEMEMVLGEGDWFGDGDGADAVWEGHTLLKTGVHTDRHKSENSVSASVTMFTWRI